MGELEASIPLEVVLAAVGVVLLLFVIIMISLWVKLNRLRKKYESMLNGAEGLNVEQILIDLQQKWNEQAEISDGINRKIKQIRQDMGHMKSHIGFYRYNAFAERGSDLSFSVAILDDQQDGVVLTGIHSREQTYMYAKPIEQGQSKYMLSPEEKEAINRCAIKG
ncbi:MULTISPECIES: DUF4446 family protein [unclassified Paenibacillus]|uniref:DUF4446 family protein n=1 Tax=unclassified Paenibacillus TaxID=185978 RepID=UPI001AEB3F1A|nr:MULTISPECIES: DUF4446 family protein [unclassified Paenibacillus]MBP1153263.1 hypothetical protein [Paenibacillus sp. PvP091]MBP1171354.1 hypothetical protein [Paenibacillus sp. PvR098]MBP2442382.1 hypothetical protein [Paenibacillus sp. PvP052]